MRIPAARDVFGRGSVRAAVVILGVNGSGDHPHPDDAGTHAMAEAVDLAMLLDGAGRGGRPGSWRHGRDPPPARIHRAGGDEFRRPDRSTHRKASGTRTPGGHAMQEQKIAACLWFDGRAEEAARYYTSLFPDSRITDVQYYGEAGPGGSGRAGVRAHQGPAARPAPGHSYPVGYTNEGVRVTAPSAARRREGRSTDGTVLYAAGRPGWPRAARRGGRTHHAERALREGGGAQAMHVLRRLPAPSPWAVCTLALTLTAVLTVLCVQAPAAPAHRGGTLASAASPALAEGSHASAAPAYPDRAAALPATGGGGSPSCSGGDGNAPAVVPATGAGDPAAAPEVHGRPVCADPDAHGARAPADRAGPGPHASRSFTVLRI
ncbi:VOC family protein [Streptomyces radiopugnans]|uniref:VOC family protein n=1 Tax=Streptomyces radiopugnans TaxID=403935 RepID=UPI003F1AED8C